MRIIIVTYFWLPQNWVAVSRVYSWAKSWSEKGVDVTVLTSRKKIFDHPLDSELPELEKVRVIEVPYSRKSDIIGWLLKSKHIENLIKIIKNFYEKHQEIKIDYRSGWVKSAEPIALKIAKEADLVVSSFGPPGAHKIACLMKRHNPDLRWIADYRDLWSGHDIIYSALDWKRRQSEEYETVAKFSDMVSAVSIDHTRRLSKSVSKPTIYVPNGFDTDEQIVRARLSNKPSSPSDEFHIVYTGVIYEESRNAEPLLKALADLHDSGLIKNKNITVDFYGSRLNPIEKLYANPRYRKFIRIFGHVQRSKALHAQVNGDLLLILESPKSDAKGVLTGKVFEYMISGRPIVCLGKSKKSELGELLELCRIGRTYEPKEFLQMKSDILETINGRGIFESYCPNIEKILCFSRQRIARYMLQGITDGL